MRTIRDQPGLVARCPLLVLLLNVSQTLLS